MTLAFAHDDAVKVIVFSSLRIRPALTEPAPGGKPRHVPLSLGAFSLDVRFSPGVSSIKVTQCLLYLNHLGRLTASRSERHLEIKLSLHVDDREPVGFHRFQRFCLVPPSVDQKLAATAQR